MSSSIPGSSVLMDRQTIIGWSCVLQFAHNFKSPPTTKDIQDKITSLHSSDEPNAKLAAQILEKGMQEKLFPFTESKNFDLEIVMYFLGHSFIRNPLYSMINFLIGRNPNQTYYNDSAAEFIISNIPNFIEQIASVEELKALAELHFEKDENKFEILQVFNMSLENPEFKKIFAYEIDQLKYEFKVEHTTFLNIFRQSRTLQPFSTIFYL
jgi:hypothetical protein